MSRIAVVFPFLFSSGSVFLVVLLLLFLLPEVAALARVGGRYEPYWPSLAA